MAYLSIEVLYTGPSVVLVYFRGGCRYQWIGASIFFKIVFYISLIRGLQDAVHVFFLKNPKERS